MKKLFTFQNVIKVGVSLILTMLWVDFVDYQLSIHAPKKTVDKVWHVDAAGTGNKSAGTDWTVENAITLDTLGIAAITAGDTIYVRAGTNVITRPFVQASNGTATAPIVMIFVKAATTHTGNTVVYSDYDTTLTSKVDLATHEFKVGNYWKVSGFYMESDSTSVLTVGTNCVIYNCKLVNDRAGALSSAWCLKSGGYNGIYYNTFSAALAQGISTGLGDKIGYNFFKNFTNANYGAIVAGSTSNYIFKNKFLKCSKGIVWAANNRGGAFDNSFFDCGTAIEGSTAYSCDAINNVMDSSKAYGFNWSTQSDINFIWNNHGDDARNANMFNGIAETGPNSDLKVTTGDPLWTHPDTGNFTVSNITSPLYRSAIEAPK